MSDSANRPDHLTTLEQVTRRFRSTKRRLRFVVLLLVVAVGFDVWLSRRAQPVSQQTELNHWFWVIGHATSTPQERRAAFLGLVAAGQREWRGTHLDGLKLDGAALPAADLGEADFMNTVFTGAQLAKAKFIKARLELADLTDADLTGADLSGALMMRAKLQRTQLGQAHLRGAILEQAEAQNAMLLRADLAGAYLLMANLSSAKLGGADLTGANLEAASLKGADLSLTRLNNTNLKDTDFTDCNWWRARGLSVLQIELLNQKFRPTAKWPTALRDDYQEWASQRDGGAERHRAFGSSR